MTCKASIRLLVLLWAFMSGASSAAQPTSVWSDTRRLLSGLETQHDRNGHFASLFRTGDGRIETLIRALNDPDPSVRDNAQLVIRYLGNRAGMDALIKRYAKSDPATIVGPVPLPLTDWDYEFINTRYLNKPDNFGYLSTQYLYALSLDGSPQARELLPRLIETARTAGTDPTTLEAVSSGKLGAIFHSNVEGLSGEALKAARFLSQTDKNHASARLIAFNQAKDKALLEIHVNHGVLAEETYYVVVSRRGDGWKFFSISLIAVS